MSANKEASYGGQSNHQEHKDQAAQQAEQKQQQASPQGSPSTITQAANEVADRDDGPEEDRRRPDARRGGIGPDRGGRQGRCRLHPLCRHAAAGDRTWLPVRSTAAS